MDSKRYFQLLELGPNPSIEELDQAYKDMVNIWHPDRFAHNPRLKRKAEEKLKEVNQAYEALKPLLSTKSKKETKVKPGFSGHGTSGPAAEEDTGPAGDQAGGRSETEAVIETGTANVLRLWSYLSKRLRRAVGEQIQAFKQGMQVDSHDASVGRGRGRGRGTAKGRGGAQARKQFRGAGRRTGSRGGMRGRSF